MLILINDGGWLTEESVSDVAKLDVFIVVDRRVAAAATGSELANISARGNSYNVARLIW